MPLTAPASMLPIPTPLSARFNLMSAGLARLRRISAAVLLVQTKHSAPRSQLAALETLSLPTALIPIRWSSVTYVWRVERRD